MICVLGAATTYMWGRYHRIFEKRKDEHKLCDLETCMIVIKYPRQVFTTIGVD